MNDPSNSNMNSVSVDSALPFDWVLVWFPPLDADKLLKGEIQSNWVSNDSCLAAGVVTVIVLCPWVMIKNISVSPDLTV